MLVVGIIVSIFLLGVITFLALSKKSEKIIKKLAFIALIVIGVSVIASTVIVIVFDKPPEEPIEFRIPGLLPQQPKAPSSSNNIMALVFAILLVLFLGVIIYVSLKDQNQGKNRKKKQIQVKR
jgi:membrane protease YdiL (CAAX protease family)